METDRYGAIGGLAANRPLLISVVFAFGLTALAVAGFSSQPGGRAMSGFAINCFAALALPAVATGIAPAGAVPRAVFAALAAGALLVVSFLAPFDKNAMLAAAGLSGATLRIGAALLLWFVLLRPLFGDAPGLAMAAPLAAALGAFGASGLLALEALARIDVLGAVASLSVAMSCLVGVGVAGDFTRAFAGGARADEAAGDAAHLAVAPTAFGALATAGVFSAGLAPGAETLDWSWRAVAYAAGGVALATATALVVTASTLSLSNVTEEIAVIENYRRQNLRRWWRPFRQVLPPSSAIAFTAILLILTVVALFSAFNLLTPVKLILLGACSLAAWVTFVSLRTGLFVFLALFASMIMIDWSYAIAGVVSPGLLVELTATAFAAALFGQIGVAWRDARNPRRNAREATEAAMVDGAYRYLASAAFALGAFAAAEASGLWEDGSAAALYLAALCLFGFFIAAPLMTSIGAIFGRD